LDEPGAGFYASGMEGTYKVIVVGCGGLGSATLYRHSRELGQDVLGLEQFRLRRPALTDHDFERTFHT
jgi:sarcosine oxidase